MADAHAGPVRRTHPDIPEITILSGDTEMAHCPVTIFEVALVAGDTASATLAMRTRGDGPPLVEIKASPGGVASFTPAAPAMIRDVIHIRVTGADAVGSISYR